MNPLPRVVFDLRTRARSGVFCVGLQWLAEVLADSVDVHLFCYADDLPRIEMDVLSDPVAAANHLADLTVAPRRFQVLREEPLLHDCLRGRSYSAYITPHYIQDHEVALPTITGIHDTLAFDQFDLFPSDRRLLDRIGHEEWNALTARTDELVSRHAMRVTGGLEQRYTQAATVDTLRRDGIRVAPSIASQRSASRIVPDASPSLALYRPYPLLRPPSALRSGPLRSVPYVMHVGRYRAHKQLDILLDAARTAGQSGCNVLFAGLGSESEKSRLAAEISRRHLTQVCQVLPELPTPLFRRTLKAAAAVVSCSANEGFALPVAEAVVLDVPVLAKTSVPALEPFPQAAHYYDNSDELAGLMKAAARANVPRPSVLVPDLPSVIAGARTDFAIIVKALMGSEIA